MTDPHLAKRRRLTIHKPFRSPLKTLNKEQRVPLQPVPLNAQPSLSHGDCSTPCVADDGMCSTTKLRDKIAGSEESNAACPLTETTETTTMETTSVDTLAVLTPASIVIDTQKSSEASNKAAVATAATAVVVETGQYSTTGSTIQEQQRQLRLLQEQIDILSTSLKVEGKASSSAPTAPDSGSATRLPALIQLWTAAARQAAENLYPEIKLRVEASTSQSCDDRYSSNRGRGRPGSTKEGQMTQREVDSLASLEAELGSVEARFERGEGADGEELGAVERAVGLGEVRARRSALRKGRDRDEDGDEEEDEAHEEEEGEQEGFTMGSMLRGMNIEWELLGWDELEQGWKDGGQV